MLPLSRSSFSEVYLDEREENLLSHFRKRPKRREEKPSLFFTIFIIFFVLTYPEHVHILKKSQSRHTPRAKGLFYPIMMPNNRVAFCVHFDLESSVFFWWEEGGKI